MKTAFVQQMSVELSLIMSIVNELEKLMEMMRGKILAAGTAFLCGHLRNGVYIKNSLQQLRHIGNAASIDFKTTRDSKTNMALTVNFFHFKVPNIFCWTSGYCYLEPKS